MARPRVVLDDDAWAAVRVAYEDTPEPVTRILARFGIQRHQLYDRIALENWRMRSSGVVKSAADVAPPVARPPPLLRVEPAISGLVIEGTGCLVEGDRPQSHAERHRATLPHHRSSLLEKMERNVTDNPDPNRQRIREAQRESLFVGAHHHGARHRPPRRAGGRRRRSPRRRAMATARPNGCVARLRSVRRLSPPENGLLRVPEA